MPMKRLLLPLLLACLIGAEQAAARSVSTSPSPPSTGLEMPGDPLKGREPKPIGGFTDAYGNPVTPDEGRAKEPKKRLPAGAYGGYGRVPAPERPLPDARADEPVW